MPTLAHHTRYGYWKGLAFADKASQEDLWPHGAYTTFRSDVINKSDKSDSISSLDY